MVLTGFAWFAAQLSRGVGAVGLNTLGLAVQSRWIIGLIYLLLSFPSGRLPGRLDRWLVAVGVGAAVRACSCWRCCTATEPGCAARAAPNNLLQVVHDNHKAQAWMGLAASARRSP